MDTQKQSRIESALEQVVNLTSGVILAYLAWLYIIPAIWPAHASPPGEAFGITIFFTVISLFRGYFWRRFFENGVHRGIRSLVRGLFG